jgi:hypothetical protein
MVANAPRYTVHGHDLAGELHPKTGDIDKDTNVGWACFKSRLQHAGRLPTTHAHRHWDHYMPCHLYHYVHL